MDTVTQDSSDQPNKVTTPVGSGTQDSSDQPNTATNTEGSDGLWYKTMKKIPTGLRVALLVLASLLFWWLIAFLSNVVLSGVLSIDLSPTAKRWLFPFLLPIAVWIVWLTLWPRRADEERQSGNLRGKWYSLMDKIPTGFRVAILVLLSLFLWWLIAYLFNVAWVNLGQLLAIDLTPPQKRWPFLFLLPIAIWIGWFTLWPKKPENELTPSDKWTTKIENTVRQQLSVKVVQEIRDEARASAEIVATEIAKKVASEEAQTTAECVVEKAVAELKKELATIAQTAPDRKRSRT